MNSSAVDPSVGICLISTMGNTQGGCRLSLRSFFFVLYFVCLALGHREARTST